MNREIYILPAGPPPRRAGRVLPSGGPHGDSNGPFSKVRSASVTPIQQPWKGPPVTATPLGWDSPLPPLRESHDVPTSPGRDPDCGYRDMPMTAQVRLSQQHSIAKQWFIELFNWLFGVEINR